MPTSTTVPPGTDLPDPGTPQVTDAPDPRRWLALAVIAVAQLMIVLDVSIVNIAIPDAGADLGISPANIQWVVTAYTLSFGGLLLLGGRVADFMGRKRAFLIGLLGFAAASGLGGLAPNQELLFAARALQGGFAALLAPAALSLLAVTFTESKERARAFAVFGAVSGGGAAIGLLLGGVLTEYASWRWTLGVNVPISIATALLAVVLVRESRASGDRHFDIPGVLLSTTGLVSLVYGFSKAAEEGVGWADPVTLTLLGAAAVLLVSFVLYERRAAHPLLPLRVVLDRNRGGSYAVFLLVGAGLFAMFLFLTFYFQETLGYTPLESGFAFLPFSGGIIIGAGVVSQLLPRIGPRPLIVVGLALSVVGMLWLTRIGETSAFVTTVLPAEIALSFGMAMVFVPTSSTALLGVEEHDAGVASAILNTAQQVGGSLGLALLNTFFASAVADRLVADPAAGPAAALVHGYHVAFVWAAVFLALALVIGAAMIRARRDELPSELVLAA
ncbi:MFS transporter [Blastococcus xanthinilyticus]|uniref:EmrB/QacA subfamily drug resistance transporter n=1 Tax=Blastococcus xanthinilyticus TaxID=1564164 RepID=A0A5S5CUZ1_9ACTN|nr:MFS transporter [Blastococcus xanthinilyticus]TYP86894.1 EmrB/QacA subfamily drug resistance transporter [Blastococcus xanthinilyticus]